MIRKLLITKIPEFKHKIFTIVIENDDIVEIHCSEEAVDKMQLGNIYVGKVKNIVPDIGAAFIEIAKGIECYYSLSQNESPIFTNKIGKEMLNVGDELVIQISKEAVKTKVPTVSSKINLTGNYVVLTGGDNHIGVSAKLNKQKRIALQEIMIPHYSEDYGFIVRTNAKDAATCEILEEAELLKAEYERIVQLSNMRTCYTCLKKSDKPYILQLRDIYKEGLSDIIIEDPILHDEVQTFLRDNQPETMPVLRYYEDKLLPLYKLYSVETCLETARKEKVWMKSGAYLVIQPTEALTVIDVNTGKCVKKKKEDIMYLKINLEAAKEAAKQIRLRNLSGIIIIDFINMDQKYMVEELLDKLQNYLRQDQIRTAVVDITKLQLVEVTRKTIRKTLAESLR